MKTFQDFNIEHVDRIIAATRLDVSPDRNTLLADLLDCYAKYKKQVSSGSFQRQQDRHISIRKAAAKIVRLLEEDNGELGVIRKMSEGASDVLLDQLVALSRVLEWGTQSPPGGFAKLNKARHGLVGSALQELVGLWLPAVYEKHFKRGAGSSRPQDGGKPDGPYVRFALQVTKEWKIDCSAETVHKAIGEKKTKNFPF